MLKKVIKNYDAIPKQVKASFWFLVCSVLQRGISVLTTPIFTRLLSPGDYGQYGVFNSWLDIISIFVTLRLYYGVFVQGLVKFETDQHRYASSMQGLLLALCTIWTAIYFLFSSFWNKLTGLTTVQMMAMLVMIWSVGSMRFWAAEQRNKYKYRLLVCVTLIVSILKPAVSIFFVLHAEDRATARILGLAIAEFIGYTWTFFVQIRRGKKLYVWQYWKHALLFNIPLIPHYLSQTVLNSADRIMIKEMVSNSAAGIYTLAYSLSKLMSMFTVAIIQTLSPWIYQKIKSGKATDISPIAYSTLICIAALNLLLIAFAPEVLVFFAPSNYHDAIWIIPPVAMSVYFSYAYQLFASFEFYYEKTRFIMIASMAGALLNIVLNFIYIQKYGYFAAGYTTLVCYALYAIGHFLFMRKVCRDCMNNVQVYDIRKIVLITSAFLGMGFILLLSYLNIFARYAIIVAMLSVIIAKRKMALQLIDTFIRIRSSKNKGNRQA